jgi:hypothetical protein
MQPVRTSTRRRNLNENRCWPLFVCSQLSLILSVSEVILSAIIDAPSTSDDVMLNSRLSRLQSLQYLMKLNNGVFWDVKSCGSCKNRSFGGI